MVELANAIGKPIASSGPGVELIDSSFVKLSEVSFPPMSQWPGTQSSSTLLKIQTISTSLNNFQCVQRIQRPQGSLISTTDRRA